MATNEITQETSEILELLQSRVNMYGMLARLYRREIKLEEMRELQSMRFPVATGNALIDEAYRDLYDYLKRAWEDSITELNVDFVRTFIGHGVNGYSAAYPFESVYTSERRLLMQQARTEVMKTMRENNLVKGRWTEGEDHLALELEFVQRLGMRAKDALEAGDEDECIKQLNIAYKFLHEHIINWIPMMVADMLKFSKTKFYQGLAKLTLGYVEDDIAVLRELLEAAANAEAAAAAMAEGEQAE